MPFFQPLALGVASLASTTLATLTGDRLPYAPAELVRHSKPLPPIENPHIPPFDNCFNLRYDPTTTDDTLFNETIVECTMQQLCTFCRQEETGLESAECQQLIAMWTAGTTQPWYCPPEDVPALAEVAPEPSHVVPRSSLELPIDPFVVCVAGFYKVDGFNETIRTCTMMDFCKFCQNMDGTDADETMCMHYSDAWTQGTGLELPCPRAVNTSTPTPSSTHTPYSTSMPDMPTALPTSTPDVTIVTEQTTFTTEQPTLTTEQLTLTETIPSVSATPVLTALSDVSVSVSVAIVPTSTDEADIPTTTDEPIIPILPRDHITTSTMVAVSEIGDGQPQAPVNTATANGAMDSSAAATASAIAPVASAPASNATATNSGSSPASNSTVPIPVTVSGGSIYEISLGLSLVVCAAIIGRLI